MSGCLQESYIPELEQEVLGALLLSGDVKKMPSLLQPLHFIEPIHRRIFDAMLTAGERYRSVRIDVVYRIVADAEDFATVQKLFPIPISEYMARLVSHTVRGTAGLKDTVPAMVQQWGRFAVGREAERIALAAADSAVDAVDLIRTASSTFDDVAAYLRPGRGRKTSYSFAEAAACAVGAVNDAMQRGTGLTGITWGLTDVDRATGGLQAGEMTILGARPGMGKTAVALSIGLNAAQSGSGVGIISLEMGARQLAMRALTDLAYDQYGPIAYNDLMTGRLSDTQFEQIVVAGERFKALPLQIEDAAGLSLSDIRVKCDRMCEASEQRGDPLKVLIVDYLQLVAASSRYQGNRVAEVSEISAGLRNIARDFSVAVLALSQLSRQVETREDKRPMLSDLRDSGSIEQDADTVALLYREAYYLQKERGKTADEEAEIADRLEQVAHKLEFIIAKQRNGPVKTIDLFIDVAASAIRNAAR